MLSSLFHAGRRPETEGRIQLRFTGERVPGVHPLRPVRKIVDEIFRGMSKQFDELYATTGRPSIAPERLLRALLLQILYSAFDVLNNWMQHAGTVRFASQIYLEPKDDEREENP